MTLTEFVLARNAERETVARSAAEGDGTDHWAVGGDGDFVYPDPPPGNSYVAVGPWGGGMGDYAAHIALNDPAHVLAWCETVRRIVAECAVVLSTASDWRTDEHHDETDAILAEHTLRLLALPDASHPDYDPAWAV